jgi:hypothetical protein
VQKVSIGLALLCWLTVSCGAAPTEDAREEGPVGTIQSDLSVIPGCATGTPGGTITGNGVALSPSAFYNPPDCFRGWKVNINGYAPGRMGMLAAYRDRAPATEAACTRAALRAIAWRRNSDGTTTLLDDLRAYGRWIPAAFGGMRCATPSIDMTAKLHGKLVRGGNYRVTLQAELRAPIGSTEADTPKNVLLSIPKAIPDPTPVQFSAHLLSLSQRLRAVPSGLVHANVSEVLQLRGRPVARGMFCRSLDVLLSLYRVNAVELKKLVPAAQASVVDQRTQNAEFFKTILCGSAEPTAAQVLQLQSRLADDLAWADTMRGLIATHLGVGSSDALALMSESFTLTLQRLLSRCGGESAEVLDFVGFNRLPPGVPGDRVVHKECSGTPLQIAAVAGIGVDTGGNQRTKYKACMDAQEAALRTDRCSGPISSEPENADTNPDDTDGDKAPCEPTHIWNADTNACEPIEEEPELTDEQIKQLIQEHLNYEEQTRRAKAHADLAKLHGGLAGAFGAGAGLATASGIGAPAAPPLAVVAAGEGIQALVYGAISYFQSESAQDSLEAICGLNPSDSRCGGGSGNRCVEYDLAGDPAWFQMSPTPRFPDGRQTTQQDQFHDCSCELFERDYGSSPAQFVFGGPTSWCSQTAEERLQQECLRNPEEPDGKPKKECLDLLEPKEVDRSALLARWCHDKMPNCPGAYVDDAGNCGCPGGITGVPAAGPPNCPSAQVINCGPDAYFDEKRCVCIPFDSGLGCGKGGLSGYVTRNPNDAFVATFPQESSLGGRNFLMVASGNTPIVTSAVRKAGLKDKSQFVVRVRLPASTVPSLYQGWAAQISCTNVAANVQNRSLTTLQFQNGTQGLNTFTFAMSAADRTACFNNDASDARFEVRTNNQAGQARIGVEDIVVTNALLDRSGVFPVDPCDVPDPVPGPLPDPVPFGQLFNPVRWVFSSGVTGEFPILR